MKKVRNPVTFLSRLKTFRIFRRYEFKRTSTMLQYEAVCLYQMDLRGFFLDLCDHKFKKNRTVFNTDGYIAIDYD